MLDYAVAISGTPVTVSDELFARLREHFDDRQLVELTNAIAVENLRGRFNLALGIGAAGFSEGMACVAPEPAPAPADAVSTPVPAGGVAAGGSSSPEPPARSAHRSYGCCSRTATR